MAHADIVLIKRLFEPAGFAVGIGIGPITLSCHFSVALPEE